jgi:preprotein translocase subunit YajC
VREIADDHVLVEIAEGVVIKVARGAVGNKIHQDEIYQDEHEGLEPENDEPDAYGAGPEEKS